MNEIPSAIKQLLENAAPFDNLDETTRSKIAQESDWVYLSSDNIDSFIKDYSTYLCLIDSGQFVVSETGVSSRFLSETDLFGFHSMQSNDKNELNIKVDTAGLILCIPPETVTWITSTTQAGEFLKSFVESSEGDDRTSEANTMWLYTKLSDLDGKGIVSIDQDATITHAAKVMSSHGVSSLLVTENDLLVGILTDRDLRGRVLAKEVSPDNSVNQVMTADPVFIEDDKTVFEALCLLNEHAIHHLPIVNKSDGQPSGILTASDIMRLQRSNVLYLMSEISKATSLYEMSNAAWKIPHYFASNAKRLNDFDIAGKVLGQATDLMTRKLIGFFEQQFGVPPMPYAWLVYGSQARQDQTLGSDQDNALLLEKKPNPEQAEYFKSMSEYVCDGLHKCGIQRCSGNIMASNPKLRISLQEAIEEAQVWVNQPTPEAILHFNIYLDVRQVAGDKHLFESLMSARAPLFKRQQFLAALARKASDIAVPLSMFNRFVFDTYENQSRCIDLKTSAVAIINSIVRTYALDAGIRVPSTPERLKLLPSVSVMSNKDAKNLHYIWQFLNQLRWRHQVVHSVTDNFVRIDSLSSIEKHQLKQAFKAIERTQTAAVNHFSGGLHG